MADAAYQQAQVDLDKAKLDVERADIHAPVNGWIIDLIERPEDHAATGHRAPSLVDADPFWVDGSFLDAKIAPIKEGEPARI